MAKLSDALKTSKAAIYIRVSTQWQIDKDSLHVQRRELIAYVEMVLGITDYVVFEDPGYSAKNTERPDYQKMMSRIRAGEFSHIVVWKIDRISRNVLDFANMYVELKSLGVTFVSKNEQFDTSTAIGEAMLKIILVFAELERNMTAERVTAVMLSRANNGQWNGGHVPYGYKYDSAAKTFSVNEDEARIVRTIFKMYEREQSLVSVTRDLNDKGILTRNGKQWSPTTVHIVLKNTFYIGQYRYNTHKQLPGKKYTVPRDESEWIVVDNHHEPIVDEELFNRIQFLLERNRRRRTSENKTYAKKNVHIFAGLLRCGVCGSNMSATTDRVRANGLRPSMYGCSKRRASFAECQNKYVNDIVIGPFIFNYLANIIRAKSSISSRTPLETLESKLLRGYMFEGVKLAHETLQSVQEMLLSGVTGMEYKPAGALSDLEEKRDERSILLEQKRKHTTALKRLNSIYLYNEDDVPPDDFLESRKNITDQLKDIEERLSQLEDTEDSIASNEQFMEKASYFLMVESLLSDRYIDYEKYIRKIDPTVPKAFLNTIISTITINKGRVMSIEFKNGMVHKFLYDQ